METSIDFVPDSEPIDFQPDAPADKPSLLQKAFTPFPGAQALAKAAVDYSVIGAAARGTPIEAVLEKEKEAGAAMMSPGGAALTALGFVAPVTAAVLGTAAAIPAGIESAKELGAGIRERNIRKVLGGTTGLGLMAAPALLGGASRLMRGRAARVELPETVRELETEVLPPEQAMAPEPIRIPIERQLPGTTFQMPEFQEGAIGPEPRTIAPESRQLPAPRIALPETMPQAETPPVIPPARQLRGAAVPLPEEMPVEGGPILTHGAEPGEVITRITLPAEPESAKIARQIWSKPIEPTAQAEGATALRQLVSLTDESRFPGQPYKPPTVNVDLRQLEAMMQRNTVSKVEGWADRVIQDKLKGAGANALLDPELLAAAATKGAILFKRGVTDFAKWQIEMRQQFGKGLEGVLPGIYEQSKQYWEQRASEGKLGPAESGAKPPVIAEQTGTIPAESHNAPPVIQTSAAPPVIPTELPTEPSFISRAATSAIKPLQQLRRSAVQFWEGRQTGEEMAVGRDRADNAAKIVARNVTNDIRGDMRRQFGREQSLAEDALSFVVESRGSRANLATMREKLMASAAAPSAARRSALKAIDYANARWNELEPMAERYKAATNTELDLENAAGLDVLKRDGYVMHSQDLDSELLGEGGEPSAFRKVRQYETFADSIGSGIKPKSLNALDLLESRVSTGQRLINVRAWQDGLKTMTDVNGHPVGADPVTVTRADGSTYQEAPSGYHLENVGRSIIAIRNGFEDIFRSLSDPSAWTRTSPRRAIMQAAGGGKSLMLAIDTFHLGRVSFWDALIKSLGIKTFKLPVPSYKRGVTLLDMSEAEIRKMAESGEIPRKWLPEVIESKRLLNLAVDTGFNVGRISDALYNDVIHSIPVIGTFNKFLFDQFQRGAMSESWLLEFNRIRKARPDMDETSAARIVTRSLNTRFGNIGRQGLFKSKTAQDTMRLLALAPQWNEGLIRSELGALKDAGRLAVDLAHGRRFYAGLLLRATGGMAVAQFVANQLINLATRGKPTWENQEEGFGSKISAWIPDLVGKGPGFFLHPLGLATETAHLLVRAYERTGDFQKTLNQYIRSRASFATRPLLTWLLNTDFLGRTLKPGAVYKEIAKDIVPVPIGGSGYLAAGKQLVTGREQETFPGQIQRQMMSSAGIKTESAPAPGQRIQRLADEYNKRLGKPRPEWQGPTSPYTDLANAVRIGNEDAARKAIRVLFETHNPDEISKHFRQWPTRPFTGQLARESGFLRSLNEEQRQIYQRAKIDRAQVARKALILVRSEIAAKRMSER